ncbi:MAG: squalene/phytoene synthase family protein [Xanthomonadales bacterium]|nr:squalene/phytoene synthase family protein [Xanthomonadales bacterium]
MSRLGPTDLEYCLPRGAPPGSVYFYTHRFAPEGLADAQLALQALLWEIRSIALDVSDPGVAMAKLAWWQQELQASLRPQSQHPVVRAAESTRLFTMLEARRLQALQLASAAMIQRDSIPDREALLAVCESVGSAEAAMLCSLSSDRLQPGGLSAMGTALLLEQFSRRIHATLPGGAWWVPLNDQARFGLTIANARAGREADRVGAFLREIGEDMANRLSAAREAFGREHAPVGRVLRVMMTVLDRRALRLRKGPYAVARRPQVTELFQAWRAALPR